MWYYILLLLLLVNTFVTNYLSPKLVESGAELVAAESEEEYVEFFRNFSGRDIGCLRNGSGKHRC